MLIELFGRRNPPILHESWGVRVAVATRRNVRATLENIPNLPVEEFPRSRFYDELRNLLLEARVFAPRRDDYRQLVACMAAREQFVLVEEHFRLLQRIPFELINQRINENDNSPDVTSHFQRNICPRRFPSDGTDAGNISSAFKCMFYQWESSKKRFYGGHWPNIQEAVFFFYRPLDFCIANIRTRDFLKDSPVRID